MKASEKDALKIITTLVEESQTKHPDKSDKRCIVVACAAKKVNNIHGQNISALTACQCIRQGCINKSPSHTGPNGKFPPHVRKALFGAYTSFMSRTQLAGNM